MQRRSLPWLRMRAEPAFAAPQQPLELVVGDPVKLLVIEHRDQHIEVHEQVLQAHRSAQPAAIYQARHPTPE